MQILVAANRSVGFYSNNSMYNCSNNTYMSGDMGRELIVEDQKPVAGFLQFGIL